MKSKTIDSNLVGGVSTTSFPRFETRLAGCLLLAACILAALVIVAMCEPEERDLGPPFQIEKTASLV